MRLIYIGFAVPENIVQKSKAVSVAGNNMEIGILNHLCEKYENQIDVISITPIASYPREKQVLHRKQTYQISDYIKTNAIGFINIPIIKQLSIMLTLIIELIKLLKSNKKSDNKTVIMTYNSMSFLSIPIFLIDLLFNIIKVCLVVDIPITFQKKRHKYLEIARYLDNFVSLKAFRKYDSMVTLVEKTANDFAPNVPYKVINYCVSDIAKNKYKDDDKRSVEKTQINITFTGAIEEYYGVHEMIQSVLHLPSHFKLQLYGKGSLVQEIINIQSDSKRIRYMGLVSNKEAVKAQQFADILLLIRTDSELNKYGLPSKIIEYLASGTPVISNRISSIPNDLNQFINYIDDTNPVTIANKISSITNPENYNKVLDRAKKAREHILENYVWEKQADKIWRHLNEL